MKKLLVVLFFVYSLFVTNVFGVPQQEWDAQFDEIRMTKKDQNGNYQDIINFQFGNYWPPYPFSVDLDTGDIAIFPKVKGPNSPAPVGVIWDTDWVGELWISNLDDVTSEGKLISTFNKETQVIVIPKDSLFKNNQAIVRLLGKKGDKDVLYDQFFFKLSTVNYNNVEGGDGGQGTVIIQVPCYVTELSHNDFVVSSDPIDLQISTTTSKVDCSWNISTTDSWIILPDKLDYTGSATFTFTVVENQEEEFRVGNIKVDNRNVTVVQRGKQTEVVTTPTQEEVCEITSVLDDSSISTYTAFSNNPSESYIQVKTSKQDCKWKAETTSDWLQITNTNERTGDSNVSFSVSRNDSQEARFAVIEIKSTVPDVEFKSNNLFIVVQRGKFVPEVEVPCFVTETVPAFAVTDSNAKSGSTSIPFELFLNKSNCSVNVVPQNDWIKVSQRTVTENDENTIEYNNDNGSSVVFNTAKIYFEVERNQGEDTRVGSIKIANDFFVIVQTPQPQSIYALRTDPVYSDFSHTQNTGTYEVYLSRDMFQSITQEMLDNLPDGVVTSQIKVFSKSSPWIDIDSFVYDKQNKKINVQYSVQQNDTEERRIGAITVLTSEFIVIQDAEEKEIVIPEPETVFVKSENVILPTEEASGFGSAVDINQKEGLIYIGSNETSVNGVKSGSVSVYDFTINEGWKEIQTIVSPTPYEDGKFGTSIQSFDDRLVIGSFSEDSVGDWSGATSGSIHVFIRNEEGMYESTQRFTPDNATDSQAFGFAVTMNKDWIIVGSYNDDQNGENAGAAYAYKWDGEKYEFIQRVEPSVAHEDQKFGVSVSLYENTLMVAAYRNDTDGVDQSGAVYEYVLDNGMWSQKSIIKSNEVTQDQWFGTRVSLYGNILAVASEREKNESSTDGSVYVFENVDGTYVFRTRLTAPEGTSGWWFGQSVSVYGDMIAVGARRGTTSYGNTGSANLYKLNENNWEYMETPIPAIFENEEYEGSQYGYRLKLGNGILLVGAPTGKGAVGVFEWMSEYQQTEKETITVVETEFITVTETETVEVCRSLSVSDESGNNFSVYDGNENTGSFDVVCSKQDCDWNVSTTSEWIVIEDLQDSYTGNATINYSIKENSTNNTRIGKIAAFDRYFVIIQAAKQPTITILFNGQLDFINPQQVPMNSTIVID